MPASHTHRTPSVEIEASLLRAADAVLRRKGLAAVTVRAVAHEAGVAPMDVYRRFGSKDRLVDAVLSRALADFQEHVNRDHESDPAERLVGSALRYRQWALTNREHYEAIFAAQLGLGSVDVAVQTRHNFAQLLARVEDAMVAGVIAHADVHEVAQQWWSAMHGAIALELHALALSPDAEGNFRMLMNALLRGLATSPAEPALGAMV